MVQVPQKHCTAVTRVTRDCTSYQTAAQQEGYDDEASHDAGHNDLSQPLAIATAAGTLTHVGLRQPQS
jgi:hypothetical protein